eukprot:CAMPEP_0115289446 /NCGR_PEP_ID=MMETSP0270-20121206/63514_1 /TAXON_ID=71861 /ORGANISM="Scrippsiella trochoidea, Strain CCMP3099" /LENGTH=103 /DNA_ID=CAMNT_0002706627 /DNA_START=1 /DNA_END=313 /DNA_ORIENTATION=-
MVTELPFREAAVDRHAHSVHGQHLLAVRGHRALPGLFDLAVPGLALVVLEPHPRVRVAPVQPLEPVAGLDAVVREGRRVTSEPAVARRALPGGVERQVAPEDR